MDELAILSPNSDEGHYQCPGESQPVSRAVHLARLSNGYEPCRGCDRRAEVGSLPKHVVRRANRHAKPRTSLMTPEGIRGVYLNQLDREQLGRMVEHVLDRADADRLREATARSMLPVPLHVVIGHDFRACSPDMVMGVVQALQRGGCQIADLGETTRPLLDFAMERLRPHLGLFVTGGTFPSAWTGLDILDSDGIPWSASDRLHDLELSLKRTPVRLGRTGGGYHLVSLDAEYEAAVAHRFHAIRPMQLGIFCCDPRVRGTLERVLERTPCQAVFLEGEDFQSAEHHEFTDQLWEQHLDFGFLIASDCRACRVFNDRGEEISAEAFRGLIERSLPRDGAGTILTALDPALATTAPSSGPAESALRKAMFQMRAPVAIDAFQRCWFADESPQCDALLTLARLLEVLSTSERSISSRV